MRKSGEFENILNECLERLLVRGETIEQCLQGFPELATELESLLETALAVNKVSGIQPHSEFRNRARYQFYAVLQRAEAKRSRPFFLWRLQWVTVVAILLAFVLASGGTVAAASGSMPDEALYPVKLATEQVQLVLTPSALGKAELYAKLADRRVAEIEAMSDESKPEDIERTAQRLDIYLTEIADLAATQPIIGGEAMLPALREAPAVGEIPAVQSAPGISGRARGNLARGVKTDRRAKLKEMVGQHASNHPARLRALLETAPLSARPALLRAITVSETGYQKALESLD